MVCLPLPTLQGESKIPDLTLSYRCFLQARCIPLQEIRSVFRFIFTPLVGSRIHWMITSFTQCLVHPSVILMAITTYLLSVSAHSIILTSAICVWYHPQSSRKELATDIEALKKKIAGTE